MWIEPDDILVLIPAFNEGNRIASVIESVKQLGYRHVLVVDDGSDDDTSVVSGNAGAIVLSHLINRGPGAATMTGIQYARKKKFQYVVTIDGDGQHDPKDIDALVEEMKSSNVDIVIGDRFSGGTNEIPRVRKVFNAAANLITKVFADKNVSDSQSGFKILGPRAIAEIDIHIDGYGFCSELFIQGARKGLTFSQVPIKVYYPLETRQKGQNFREGIRTAAQIIQHVFWRD